MISTKSLLVLFTCLLAVTVAADPESPASEPADFEDIDRDGDGLISEEEARTAGFGEHFAQTDDNEDGKLSAREFYDLDRRMGHDILDR